MTAKALQIIVKSGKPTGIKMVRVSGWDGLCYMVPRQALSELSTNSDVNHPGLYFLFGKDDTSNKTLGYIGESEEFYKRITSHNGSKDFWDEALVFTGELNKAHVKYLERTAIEFARSADRVELQNSNTPGITKLSEFDRVAVDLFFSNVTFILETFGYNIFKTVEEAYSGSQLYYLKTRGCDATAKLLDSGGMTVLAGSLCSIAETNSFGGWAQVARQDYLRSGLLVAEGANYRLTQDVTFRSPSAAAATVAAKSINGWTAWKDASEKTLDENVRKMKDGRRS